MTEGYIKFYCNWSENPVKIPEPVAEGILKWRAVFFKTGLIGSDKNGIGYGNISARVPGEKTFFITGSATGSFPEIHSKHLVRVDSYNFKKNRVDCTGEIRASAETLTHAAVYEAGSGINGIIHVHHRHCWENLYGRVPTTANEAAYGTPAMASEILRLLRNTDAGERKITIMGGHPEGILTFGKDLEEAGTVLLAYLNNIEM